jgi:ubiquinone/menaquinone biosynthesis C-methylase UbiE
MGENTNIQQALKEQYKTAENLITRGNLHSYNINKTDWNNWCFNQMAIPEKARILELGCGTGDFWYKNRQSIKNDWNITLSDFSMGMINSAKKRSEDISFSFTYKEIDAQDIPYENECFDIVIARHMLYLVPDIEKALSEIKRVLARGGTLYVTTNSHDAMAELNALVEKFDSQMELHNNGMGDRFDMEDGYLLLKKYFSEVETDIFQGKIVVDNAEPIVNYKASTVKGRSILVREKKEQFMKYVEDYIRENGNLSITTKACIFKARN